jgi:hypothetical protein
MQARLVLSEGEWISVPLPKGRDPSWTVADEYTFAAAYASAIRKYEHARATNVAEAAVLRRIYPGLLFDKLLEQNIQSIIPK